MIIYKTTNIVNGKIYIGRQLHTNPTYIGSGTILHRAIKKYGINNFKKEIIEHCSSLSDLNEKEKFWIEKLNSTNKNIGYNIMIGGQGGNTFNYKSGPKNARFGITPDQKTRDAVAKANKLRPKVYGESNKTYKKIDDTIKDIIIKLSSNIGRDKIHNILKKFKIEIPSRTIARRLKEWNTSSKIKNSNRHTFPIDRIIIENELGIMSDKYIHKILQLVTTEWTKRPNISKEDAIKIASEHINL